MRQIGAVNLHARGAERGGATLSSWIWVREKEVHPLYAGTDEGLCARASAASVVAGLQGDYRPATPRLLPCLLQGADLRVRPAGGLREPAAHHLPGGILDHRAHRRVRAG